MDLLVTMRVRGASRMVPRRSTRRGPARIDP